MYKAFCCSLTVLVSAIMVVLPAVTLAGGGPMPIRTEIFQELSIEETGEIPKGVTNLQSIKVEPINDEMVKYLIKFDGQGKTDTMSLAERYAYQDLETMHIFDFYNCYSVGAIDGIAIRRFPVTAVDRKMYKSKDGTYVLRIVFVCREGAKATISTEGYTVAVLFKTDRKISPAAKAAVSRKKEKSGFVRLSKKVLYGIGATALVGVTTTYFLGFNKGKDVGMDEEFNYPRSRLPAFPSQEEAFPPTPD